MPRNSFSLLITAAVLGIVSLPCSGQQALLPLTFRAEINGQIFGIASGSTINFAAKDLLTPVNARLTMTNIAQTQVEIPVAANVLGPNSFSISDLIAPITLQPGQSTSFNVTYLPTTTDAASGALSIFFRQSDPQIAGTIVFSLLGGAPRLVAGYILPTDANFRTLADGATISIPPVLVNSNFDVTLTIQNRGSAPTTVNALSLTGSSSFELLGLPLFPLALAPGTETRIALRYLPRQPGAERTALTINLEGSTIRAEVEASAVSTFLQYQLVRESGSAPIAGGQTINLGDVKSGETSSFGLEILNTATTGVTVNFVSISGQGFGISEAPPVPLTLQPQQRVTLRVSYLAGQPGDATGRLTVGSDVFPLTAKSLGPLLRYSYFAGGVEVQLTQAVVSFPTVPVGQSSSARLVITNRGTSPGTLVSAGILDTRGVFRISEPPALPADIAAGSSISIPMEFTPQQPGQSQSTLLLDGLAITLSGFSTALPPLPGWRFTGASGRQEPFSQVSVGLELNSAFPVALRGRLVLTTIPEQFADDPAIQFSTGGRAVEFTIPVNSTRARFANGAETIQLQTGTVALAILLTPSFFTETGVDLTPPNPAQQRLEVPRQAPVLLTGRIGTNTSTVLSVVLSGYATTRALDRLDFEFTAGEGATLSTARISVNVSAEARLWFQSAASQAFGGQFTIEMPFSLRLEGGGTPVAGLTSPVRSVKVTAVNAAGTSNTLDIVVP